MPPAGTTLCTPLGTAGFSRRPSLMTASKYLVAVLPPCNIVCGTCSSWSGSWGDWCAVSISSWRRWRTLGLLANCAKMLTKVAAVVSLLRLGPKPCTGAGAHLYLPATIASRASPVKSIWCDPVLRGSSWSRKWKISLFSGVYYTQHIRMVL